jgi:DNA-binding response OmpR family regulator
MPQTQGKPAEVIPAGCPQPVMNEGIVPPKITVPARLQPAAVPRILVVDDDGLMLTIIRDVLRNQLFEVATALDGYRALELFSSNAISLVILDWKMPGLRGEEVFDKLAAIREDVKVIVISGDNPRDVERAFEGRNVLRFVTKPFHVGEFVAVVKAALEG